MPTAMARLIQSYFAGLVSNTRIGAIATQHTSLPEFSIKSRLNLFM
jgi:hypothetical protein